MIKSMKNDKKMIKSMKNDKKMIKNDKYNYFYI